MNIVFIGFSYSIRGRFDMKDIGKVPKGSKAKPLIKEISFLIIAVLLLSPIYGLTSQAEGVDDLMTGASSEFPVVSIVGFNDTLFETMGGTCYIEEGGEFNITIVDDVDGHSHFSKDNTTYQWGEEMPKYWNGSAITFPFSQGTHELNITAIDSDDNVGYFECLVNMSIYLINTTLIADTDYSSQSLLVDNVTVGSGYNLKMTDCSVIFIEEGSYLHVEADSTLNISGTSDGITETLRSFISTIGGAFHITGEIGSTQIFLNTIISADETSSSPDPLFDLYYGRIDNCEFNDLTQHVRVSRSGSSIQDSSFDFSGYTGGIIIDLDHTYGPRPVTLSNLNITGSPDVGIEVIDAAVWTPDSLKVSRVFYAGGSDASYIVDLQTLSHITDWNTAYMVLPHFMDSRDDNSTLYVRYMDPLLKDLSTFTPVKNVTFKNWTHGDEISVDLSTMSGNETILINWSSAGEGKGSAFISTPLFGDYSANPQTGTPTANTWMRMNVDSVQIDNVTIADSKTHFIRVNSSGFVRISNVTLGSDGSVYLSNELIGLIDSTLTLMDMTIKGQELTQRGIIHTFGPEDDWGTTTLENVTLKDINGTGATAIFTQGGRIYGNDLFIQNCHGGIHGDGTLFELDRSSFDTDAYGAHIILPDLCGMGEIEIMMNGVTITDYSEFGILIEGDVDYKLNISLDSIGISSTARDLYEREDGMGGLIIDISSTTKALMTLTDSTISYGPGHGIVMKRWDADGIPLLRRSDVTNQDLDGIYLSKGVEVKIEEMGLESCDGYGIYSEPNTTITANNTDVALNFLGGIWMDEGTIYDFQDMDINNNLGVGVYLSPDCEGSISASDISVNTMGIYSSSGNTLILEKVDIFSNAGDGIRAIDTNLTTRSLGASSKGARLNGGNGIYMTGGAISMKSYRLAKNTNDGLYLEDVKLVEMDTPMINENGGNGLHIHFTSNTVLDSEGYYGLLININSNSNSWNGLKFTYDPLHLTKKVKLEISRITIHSNMGGDIISAEQVHIDWKTMDVDALGVDNSVGVVRANMDIDIKGAITIKNMNISLIGTDRKITVNDGMSLTLNNCDIRAVTPNYGFSIDVLEGASLKVNGGILSPLSSLHAVNAFELKMTDTLIRYGEAPIIVEGTEITLDGCRFENVDGEALLIKNSKGNITRTSFSSNTIGIMIEGLSGDLTIDNSSFKDNSWGVYLFDGGSHYLNITMCEFTDNSPSGVRVKGGEVNLLDCSLESSTLSVVGSAGMILVKYTLTVEVLNEIGENEEFSLKIERGDDTTDHEAIQDRFSSPLITYEIDEDGTTDLSRVDLTMTYAEGTERMTITLDSRRHIIFNGYRAPVPIKENFTISALEDIGIDGPLGTVDVSLWFTDLGGDGKSLIFSVRVGTPEITPIISGSLLSLELKENWWGDGNFTLIARDQYGMTTSILVHVEVENVNDVPIATNARIDPINPRSGDTIKAKWEWSDVDEGDYQFESTYFINWYLNGEYQPEHDNALEIASVKHEQIWNFTIYPADQFSWINGLFGPGASSRYVIVLNSAPTLDDVLITTRYPKTTNDLLAQPGEWSDEESNMVMFHYQWEIRKKIDSEYVWVPIGAPDSPILSSQFTKKDDSIRVGAWASDGIATSDIVYSEVKIWNSLPRIISAELTPSILDETVDLISVANVVWEDDDGDEVTLYFNWEVGGTSIALPPEYSELRWDIGGWNYPGNPNVTVRITPKDDEVLAPYGETYAITLHMTPMDTDGDGEMDIYDDDDDDDGFLDVWEEYMGSDPKSPYSRPVDTDLDGRPDGVKYNPETWMDTDDDNDGIPDDSDSSPLNPAMPGDMDGDHIGDDVDPDIDGDRVPNEKDFAPYNPYVTSRDEKDDRKIIETITLILLLLIFLGIIGVIFLFITGRLELPVSAPPPTGGGEDESAEAIFDEEEEEQDEHVKGRRGPPLDAFDDEDLEDMTICSNCGELVTEGTSICPNCDAEFEEMDDEDDYEE